MRYRQKEETMSEKQMTKQEMLNHLEKGMDLVKKRYGSADEEYYSALKELGIEFSEERLIEDYSRVKDTEALFDAYINSTVIFSIPNMRKNGSTRIYSLS
jgi:hypothetical protein